jgi:uncharacterized protein (DUF1697 family)
MALVVFLRGVNVGGHRRFRPTELARELRHLDVKNLGAAGTFVVRGPVGRDQLEEEVRQRLPFEATIAICEGVEVLDLIDLDPFADQVAASDAVRFVSIVSGPSGTRPRFPLSLPSRGRWLVKVLGRHGPFFVGQYRRQMKTIGWLNSLDHEFGVPLATRSWSTFGRIGRVLREGEALLQPIRNERIRFNAAASS